MNVCIRRFEEQDIANKVKWINDPRNNAYLHYDLPLESEKTKKWFDSIKDRKDRFDAVIEVDGVPVGLIGLLSIDKKNSKCEYYITLGEQEYIGKRVASKATKLLLEYAFSELGLNRVYLYTEVDNTKAEKLYESAGFKREGVLKNDLFCKGRFVDRYVYGITKKDFYHQDDTPIQKVADLKGNTLYIKREDFIPFSFGGNKARKAQMFFEIIEREKYDCVVTYGSSSSNHCRVVANMAAAKNLPCYIISPQETSECTYNSDLMTSFGAKILSCPVSCVRETIEKHLTELKGQGRRPYFIAGGGHGNIGTQAFVNCYEEIRRFEKENCIHFDYIFHASGTGTTQAGLVCGQLINREERTIVGISIARRNPRGRDVVVESIKDYLAEQRIDIAEESIEKTTVFIDDYVGGGYGVQTPETSSMILDVMKKHGIPLDSTYTGKAFAGMSDYVEKASLKNKNILFIHTGGTPLYFNDLDKMKQ